MLRATALSAIVIIAVASVAPAQSKKVESTRKQSRDPGHMVLLTRLHPLTMLRNIDIRQELKMTPEQESAWQKCWDKRDRYRKDHREAVEKLGDQPNAQDLAALEAQGLVSPEVYEKQLDIEVLKLLDTRQRIRFDQVGIQLEQDRAFTRPEFQARLNMSPGQIEAILQIIRQRMPEMEVVQQTRERYRELQRKAEASGEGADLVKSDPKFAADVKAVITRRDKANDQISEARLRQIFKLLRKKQIETYQSLCGEPYVPGSKKNGSDTETSKPKGESPSP